MEDCKVLNLDGFEGTRGLHNIQGISSFGSLTD